MATSVADSSVPLAVGTAILSNEPVSDGGAIVASVTSEVRMHDGSLIGNMASGNGGAVAARSGSTVEFEGVVVADNVASHGGAFFIYDTRVSLMGVKGARNVAVEGAVCTGVWGGGVRET